MPPVASLLNASLLNASLLAPRHGPFAVADGENGQLSTISYGRFPMGFVKDDHKGLTGSIKRSSLSTFELAQNVRGYLVTDYRKHEWSQINYEKLDLLGKTLSYTVDVSKVDCGCNAALYLVAMDRPTSFSSGYCDIQSAGDNCLEIDLMEANRKAFQTTLHSQTGTGFNGDCNQYGCSYNWGKHATNMYGQGSGCAPPPTLSPLPPSPPSGGAACLSPTPPNPSLHTRRHKIDSSKPYEVAAHFGHDGEMTVTLTQGGRSFTVWDTDKAGNYPEGSNKHGVPKAASAAVRKAMLDKGVVLVGSLWGGGDMSWLDGGCSNGYSQCSLSSAQVAFTNLKVSGGVDAPPEPPYPPAPPFPPPVPPGTCQLEPNLNCYGSDLAEAPCDSPAECCDRCKRTQGCQAFTHDQWDPHGNHNPTCYLKSACTDRRQDSSAVSGLMQRDDDLVELGVETAAA